MEYFLYTDDASFQSRRWNVVYTPLVPASAHMDAARVTAKQCKWFPPSPLRTRFDYLLFIDAKLTAIDIHNGAVSLPHIVGLVAETPNAHVFFNKWGSRHANVPRLPAGASYMNRTLYDEVEAVKHAEQRGQIATTHEEGMLDAWRRKLERAGWIQRGPAFVDTAVFLRRAESAALEEFFSSVYYTMMAERLLRDQLVFMFALESGGFHDYVLLRDMERDPVRFDR